MKLNLHKVNFINNPRITGIAGIFLFVFILLFPVFVHSARRICKVELEPVLYGFNDKVDFPHFSKKKWLTSEFQNGFVSYVSSNLKGRKIFIQNYCNLQYALFHLANNIIGHDDYMFESGYIDAHYGFLNYDGVVLNDFSTEERQKELKNYVAKLESVQKKLKECNKTFLFFITPSKVSFYENKVPQIYKRKGTKGLLRGYTALKELLEKADVNCIDFHDHLSLNQNFPVFYKGGTHWSRPAEQLMTLQVVSKLKELSGKNIPEYRPGELKESDLPFFRDDDLLKLSNISRKFDKKYYEYETQIIKDENFEMPRVLVQGGSFSQGLGYDYFNHFPEDNYSINYKKAFFKHNNLDFEHSIKIDTFESIGLESYFDRIDFVVVEINESAVGGMSNGFVDFFDNFLDNYMEKNKLK